MASKEKETLGRPAAATANEESNGKSIIEIPMDFNSALQGALPASEVTGQFELVEKELLVGKTFVIVDWDTVVGDFNREYYNVSLITPQNERLCFNDGGVGIGPALAEVAHGTRILCKKGLKKSEYDTVVDGKPTHGITYYLSS